MMALIGVCLVLLALIGEPLFVVFGLAAMLFFSQGNAPFFSATNDIFSEKFAGSAHLMTIPLFTFIGYTLAESGTPARFVRLAKSWLGSLPGGLAIVCVFVCTFFTVFTGGSGVTILALGGLLLPALLHERYEEKFSLGLITTSGSLGLLFFPSLPLLVYSFLALNLYRDLGTEFVAERLFVAGIIPGILTMAVLIAYGIRTGVIQKMQRHPFVLSEALSATKGAAWELLIPFVLVGSWMLTSKLVDAAAFTAFYVVIVETLFYKNLSFRRDLPKVVEKSTMLVGAILIILATSSGFTSYLIQAQVPDLILGFIQSAFGDNELLFLLAVNVFLLVAGMFMDVFTAIFVVAPLLIPIAQRFGIDPYHLGIVFLLNLEIGYMTPPVGLNLFIASLRFQKPVTLLYRAVIPFVALLGGTLVLTTYLPTLTTFLPNTILGEVSSESSQEVEDHSEDTLADISDGADEDDMDLDDLDLDDLEGDSEENEKNKETPSSSGKKDSDDLDLDDLAELEAS